jgi:hypothetical protein
MTIAATRADTSSPTTSRLTNAISAAAATSPAATIVEVAAREESWLQYQGAAPERSGLVVIVAPASRCTHARPSCQAQTGGSRDGDGPDHPGAPNGHPIRELHGHRTSASARRAPAVGTRRRGHPTSAMTSSEASKFE